MNKNEILNTIFDKKLIAVIRMKDSSRLFKVVEAILEGGVSVIEITMTVPGAVNLIRDTTIRFGSDVLIGAGSVLNSSAAAEVIDAGARFVVSPVYKEEIVSTVKTYDLPVMPGAFTPTEILAAYEAGADIVKVFPADVAGMSFFRSVLAPMPHLKLMPTGGVTLQNAGEWIRAGACAVGIGSALTDSKAIMNGQYQVLTENAKLVINNINIEFQKDHV